MAVGKEIRVKIASVQNTQKITRAMEMVATSKMRKAQERMRATRPYAEKMRNVIAHVAESNSEYRHPFLVSRPVRRVGVIVVSTDRGLCGGLNSNLFRQLIQQIKRWQGEQVEFEFCTVGRKAAQFFQRIGGKVTGQVSKLGDQPHIEQLIGAVKIMLDAYIDKSIDEIYVASNDFVNSMTQKPTLEQLVPLKAQDSSSLPAHWDYIYEPEAKEVMDHLLTRYIESLVYQRVVENIACEQAARMVAMKSASDNAGKLIKELQLIYNKARQAAITQELAEIVGGASAV
ncbi:MAG: F0F1 ATP synthase subunit gamma [Gammaproteobacteria bacterium]|nr:F0F1 ATP synthase subunit gamma [Gammaproteobacteria bacterium]